MRESARNASADNNLVKFCNKILQHFLFYIIMGLISVVI